MTEKVFRNYLEIDNIGDFRESQKPFQDLSLKKINPKEFLLNKFFYKNIGKKHQWNDRLIWSERNWIDYVSDKKLSTFVLKKNREIAGYFEMIFREEIKEVEIAYFGILEEYLGKGMGGYLLSEAIKRSFLLGSKRIWLHTCSLDHENALKNYLSRGMRVFKKEIILR